MRLITVSREYGAGGAEVARRLAADIGWTLLDRELMRQQWPWGEADPSAERRVMTLTGELGAGDSSLGSTSDRVSEHSPLTVTFVK